MEAVQLPSSGVDKQAQWKEMGVWDVVARKKLQVDLFQIEHGIKRIEDK